MLSSREVGDEPVEMVTKAISMVLNRQLPSDISNKPARIKDSHVTFPPPDDLLGSQAMDMSHVDTQVNQRGRPAGKEADRQSETQRQTDRQTADRSLFIHGIFRQTDRQTDRQKYILKFRFMTSYYQLSNYMLFVKIPTK